ncbi:MAG: hypothetical protein AB8B84_09305 [Granulosicoccus sp.]
MTVNESLSLLACQISIPEMTTVAERDTHLANTCDKVANVMAGEQVDLVVWPWIDNDNRLVYFFNIYTKA